MTRPAVPPRAARLAAVVLAAGVAGTACSGGGSSPTPAASLTAGSSTTPTPSVSGATGTDDQRAHAIQLTAADLPTGWTSAPVTTTAAKRRSDNAFFDGCLHVPVINDRETAYSEVQFSRSDGLSFVDSLIDVTTTAASAAADLAAISGPLGLSCERAAAQKFIAAPKGGKVDGVTVTHWGASGPGRFGFRIVVSLTLANGRHASLYLDDLGLVVGRFEIQTSVESALQAPNQALETSVTTAEFGRAATDAQ